MSMSSARRLPLSFAGDDSGAIGLWIGLRRGSGEDDVNGRKAGCGRCQRTRKAVGKVSGRLL